MRKISIACPVFNGNEKKYLDECVDTGWISANGRFVAEFEKRFADFCGVRYAVACANGTVSLHLILLALGLGPGDEVVMPALTYIATANSVRYCGATPVFADSDEKTFNLNPDLLEAAITPRTRAIMPVHLYGAPCDMDRIAEIAAAHSLAIIEDAAEAHGALYRGRRVGGLGLAASFSFFGNKIITCGEGGMVLTNDQGLCERMKSLRGQGVSPDKRYWHDIIGYNYRMTNMQAAVGLGQLENIPWHLERRRRVADQYRELFADLGDYLFFQQSPADSSHAYWMTCIVLKDKVKLSRDEVMARMERAGIEMRPAFYPLHLMPPYRSGEHYPAAEAIGSRGLCLPSHAELSQDDLAYIRRTFGGVIGS
jgi:perosamine synthetase